ncbi:MAG TPA: hemolysin III family protein [Streptosporangiaceae bacterium]|nr:hemolysin III family protein [Streptosporangiaceae bacterium]
MAVIEPTPAAAPPSGTGPAAGFFYDARRGVHYTKPVMRGWLHLLWFVASLGVSTVLLARAHGAARVASIVVYAASVSALFGISALYHCGTWSSTWRQRLQRLDHAMIFFLIAGTATPTFVLAARGGIGVAGLIVLWTLTGAAAAIHMAWMNAPERLVGGTFIALGWVAALALPEVWIHSGAVPGVLMLAGGLLYLTGAVSYHFRWPDPYPSVFGYHEVFHTFVCAAAACQYAAIALYIT